MSNQSSEPKIKQEIIPVPKIMAGRTMNSQMEISRNKETIEYIPNELDDDNIQGNYHLLIFFFTNYKYCSINNFSGECFYNYTYAGNQFNITNYYNAGRSSPK